MLAAAIIVFREAIEAGLIVGIVLAASRGVPGRMAPILCGLLGGVLGAVAVAGFAGQLAALFDGSGQEVFNAAILAVAVPMLAWHVAWMARHGRQMAAELRAVGAAVMAGRRPVMALGVVVGVAVLREGVEVVLFLYGVAAAGEGPGAMAVGGSVGLLLAAGLTALTYFGLVRLPAHRLFGVTNGLVTLLAAGLAAQSAHLLQSAGLVEAGSGTLWDSSRMLSDGSLAGRMLHTLIGYTDRPTALEGLVYLVTLLAIAGLARVAAGGVQPRSAATIR